jgi:hypothetical protein
LEIADICTRLRDRIKVIADDLPLLKSRADPSDPLASHIIDRVLVAADNAMGCVVLAGEIRASTSENWECARSRWKKMGPKLTLMPHQQKEGLQRREDDGLIRDMRAPTTSITRLMLQHSRRAAPAYYSVCRTHLRTHKLMPLDDAQNMSGNEHVRSDTGPAGATSS